MKISEKKSGMNKKKESIANAKMPKLLQIIHEM